MLPPTGFFPTLITFHLFPLHAPFTLYLVDAPFGRFSINSSKWNLPGNIAWAGMELVAPITFLMTLYTNGHLPLTPPAKILSSLYLVHYLHRAVISPLVLSPKRSPLHISIPFGAALFNLFNGYLLAIGLAFYPPKQIGTTFWLGIVGWAIGFAGNVYHDEILNDLRRSKADRLTIKDLPEDKDPNAGRYKIPRGGLFGYVSFPNYLCEWFEWTSFALAASPYPFITVPPPFASGVGIASLATRTIANVWWPSTLLSPPWMFVLAEITSMLPRAISGHAWYKDKFGAKYPQDRKAVVPGLI
ncbi:hypothetical protein CI109_101624 [Kwoniella shandongensis]|uniref:Uncharacterized protein n=1 Tax=Kwoniella shandongensis TaxID=1734106 RepID=A0A5M6C5N8_9TREE|nr:uncharacterized protein CI109_001251 [Kwoniella shandongensis]KAA5530448.1 hypothetical protein CI109_001251 [Kwoniella shandongensis]